MATKTAQREIALLVAQGLGYHQVGNLKAARATYLEVLKKDTENAEALHLLGCLLDGQGNTAQAIKLLVRAVKSNPQAHAYFYNLANMQLKQGNAKEAIRCYREAIRIKPDYAVAHNNLGQALAQTGLRSEAKACFLNAISIQSNYADAHYNLGIELKIDGDLDGAIGEFLRSLQIQPRFADAYCNLGGAYLQTQHLSQAVASYTKAIEIEPKNFKNHTNLGAALLRMGRQQDAITSFQDALKLNPNDAPTRSNLILASSYTTADAKALQLLSDEWEQVHCHPLRRSIKSHANPANPEKRLRIGFVSADFRNHAAAYWIEPVLSNFKHDDFEVFCYSSNVVVDSTTERFRLYTDQWVESAGVGDEALAERIRRDTIDILVDLSSHTEGNRLLVFARHPAPVQVSWFGFPISTGLKSIQYRITDKSIDPPEQTASFYSEELVHLNRFYAAYRPEPTAPKVDAGPVSRNNYITFASVNSLAKIAPPTLELWADILSGIQNSRLIFQSAGLEDVHLAQQVCRIFAERGVTADRLSLRGWTPMSDFLLLGQEADIALDPFPFNGGVTTCHTLWMGLPVITLSGQSAASRVGNAILSSLGLSDLVAHSPEDYKIIARNLACDRARLAMLRDSMRSRMESHGLLDGASLCREVQVAFRNMWHVWCAKS